MPEYVAQDGVNGYLYDAPSAVGGLVLLPHAVGIQAQTRREAQLLADQGITTLLWDPYPGYDAEAASAGSNAAPRPAITDEQALTANARCLDFLLGHPGILRVGALGYCMGGRMALTLAARDRRLAVCVSYYPTMLSPRKSHQFDPVEDAAKITCPVQVLYGGRDDVTSRDAFMALRDALDQADCPTMIHVYPQADHGFMNDRNQAARANHTATQLAWPQTVALLKASLGT